MSEFSPSEEKFLNEAKTNLILLSTSYGLTFPQLLGCLSLLRSQLEENFMRLYLVDPYQSGCNGDSFPDDHYAIPEPGLELTEEAFEPIADDYEEWLSGWEAAGRNPNFPHEVEKFAVRQSLEVDQQEPQG